MPSVPSSPAAATRKAGFVVRVGEDDAAREQGRDPRQRPQRTACPRAAASRPRPGCGRPARRRRRSRCRGRRSASLARCDSCSNASAPSGRIQPLPEAAPWTVCRPAPGLLGEPGQRRLDRLRQRVGMIDRQAAAGDREYGVHDVAGIGLSAAAPSSSRSMSPQSTGSAACRASRSNHQSSCTSTSTTLRRRGRNSAGSFSSMSSIHLLKACCPSTPLWRRATVAST